MPFSYIKQSGGKWAVFSEATDAFECFDMGEEDLVRWYVERAKQQAEWDIRHILKVAEVHPTHHTNVSLKQACRMHLKSQSNVTDKDFKKKAKAFCLATLKTGVSKKKYRTVSKWHCNECGSSWERRTKDTPKICPRCRRSGAMRWEGDIQKEVK